MTTQKIFTPRPYQADAVEALKKGFKRGKKGTLVLPTGGGKTFTAWNFLKDELDAGKKILWVIHRWYLAEQCIEGMERNGIKNTVSFWNAEEKDDSGDVVIAMIMSTRNLTGDYDWVIYDECHRAAALSYKNLESQINFVRKMGLSATPERLDSKDLDLGNIFYQISFRELVDLGFLSEPDVQIIHTGQTFQFTLSGGDISKRALKKLNNPERNKAIMTEVLKDGVENRKILIFGVDIEHICELRDIVEEKFEGKCFFVHSKLSKKERDSNLIAFGKAKSAVLCNCEVFTEGYDQPDITDIVMGRPTVSKSLWVQMVGRGARIIKGVKDSFKLWIPIDDLNKYSWLARDWCLTEGNIDIQGEVTNVEERTKVVEEACREMAVELPKISRTEKLTMVGIVATLGLYKGAERQTYVITEDRFKCLSLLKYYFNEQPTNETTKDYVELSYAYCVTAGEFTVKEWKDISWAYYYSRIKGSKFTQGTKSIWAEKWVYKPKVSDAQLRLAYDANSSLVSDLDEVIKDLVEEANGFRSFWNDLVKEAMPFLPKSSKWVKGTVKSVRFKKRSLIIQTDVEGFKPSVYKFGQVVGRLFADKIGDDNIVTHMRMEKK